MRTPKTKAKVTKQTKSEAWLSEIRKTVKGRESKQVLDDFAAALDALVTAVGKTEAMALYTKCGLLITMSK